MIILRAFLFAAVALGLCPMLTGCTGQAVRVAEAHGHLSADKVSAPDYDWSVKIQARGLNTPGGNLYESDTRLKLARHAIDCPSATLTDETTIPRGTFMGLKQQYDYIMKLKC